MKRYFIKHGDFANVYDLVYTTSPEDSAKAMAEGYEQITRREAEAKCRAERQRRKDDPSFAYYAPACVCPYGYGHEEDFDNYPWLREGYLVVRCGK